VVVRHEMLVGCYIKGPTRLGPNFEPQANTL
jgi:hypothetical protein